MIAENREGFYPERLPHLLLRRRHADWLPAVDRQHGVWRRTGRAALAVFAALLITPCHAGIDDGQTRPAHRITGITVSMPADRDALTHRHQADLNQANLDHATVRLIGLPLTTRVRTAARQQLMAVLDTGVGDWRIDTSAPLDDDGHWRIQAVPPPVSAAAHPPKHAASPPVSALRTTPPTTAARSPTWTRPQNTPAGPAYDRWLASPSPALIVRDQRLLLLKTDTGVHRFPVAVGRPGHATPVGVRRVHSVTPDPVWYPTEGMRRDAAAAGRVLPRRVPPGPGNPLGGWFIALGDAIGIHGTPALDSIGRAASRGCVRMRPADVAVVAQTLTAGDTVTIVDTLPATAL